MPQSVSCCCGFKSDHCDVDRELPSSCSSRHSATTEGSGFTSDSSHEHSCSQDHSNTSDFVRDDIVQRLQPTKRLDQNRRVSTQLNRITTDDGQCRGVLTTLLDHTSLLLRAEIKLSHTPSDMAISQ